MKVVPEKSEETGMERWQRLSPWLSLFILSFVIRAWRVNDWLLPNVDEIVLMLTMKQGFLEGCSASSAYWPAHLIIKAFFFLNEFHHYRFISALFGSATILVLYSLAQRLVSKPVAWAFCLMLSFEWYFLYMSRIIEIASFIPLLTALCLWTIFRWQETRKPVYVLWFFGLGGFAANIWTPPMFYFIGAGTVYFLWSAVRNRLSWRWLIISIAVLCFILMPYLYVLWNEGRIQEDILLRYQMIGASEVSSLPANIAHAGAAIETWTHLITCFHEQLPWRTLAPLGILMIILPPLAFRWIRDSGKLCALLFLAMAQLVLLALSPVPLYIEGHAGPLLFCILLLLLGITATQAPVWLRSASGTILILSLIASFGFAPQYLDNQQSRLRDWLQEHIVAPGIQVLCLSDGAHTKFIRIPEIDALGLRYAIFTNAPDDPFWERHSPAEFPVIISTYECNMDAYVRNKGFYLQRQFTMNNLFEAHLRHGIDVWRVALPLWHENDLRGGTQ